MYAFFINKQHLIPMASAQQKNFSNRFEIVIFSIIITLIFWNFLSSYKLVNNDPVFKSFSMSDEAVYAWQAEKISNNFLSIFSNQVNEYHPPLLPTLLAVGKSIQKKTLPVLAYRHTALTISIFSLVILYLLATRISGRFLGLFCLLGMMEFPAFMTYKFFILNDILLMMFTTLLLLALSLLKPDSSWKSHCIIGVILSFVVLAKWTGAILIPFTFFYYISQPSKKLFLKELKNFILFPGAIISVILMILFLRNIFLSAGLLPCTSAFSSAEKSNVILALILQPSFLIIYLKACFIPFISLFPFFLLGCFFALCQKNKFLISLIVLLLIGISANLMLTINDPRYVLYLQPAILILTGTGIENLCKKCFKNPALLSAGKWLMIIFYIIIILQHTTLTKKFFRNRISLIDYSSAGEWIKEHSTDKTIIFSQEERSVRYFTGFDYDTDGGNIYICPRSMKDLKNAVQKINKDIIIETNIFREKSCIDYKPFSAPKQTAAFLNELGFVLKKEFYIETNSKIIPSIKIFERKSSSRELSDLGKQKR